MCVCVCVLLLLKSYKWFLLCPYLLLNQHRIVGENTIQGMYFLFYFIFSVKPYIFKGFLSSREGLPLSGLLHFVVSLEEESTLYE